MRIGIYDPYLDTLGGGERYVLSIATYLSKKHKVKVFWNEKNILTDAELKFGLDLKNVALENNIFNGKSSIIKKSLITSKYDVIIYLSDGSIPFLSAKKNILILQFPVNWVNGKDLITRAKFKKIDKVICYTNFVKKYLDKTFPKKAIVLYPAIDGIKNKIIKKEKIILNVGRFTKAINAKKQEVLVDVFKQMVDSGLKDYKLVLTGSYLSSDKDFFDEIKKKSSGYPIEIVGNLSFDELSALYGKAEIYWHAAGFDEDLDEHPERAEHFGITTLEAMSARCVPIVFNGGGQVEIVEDNRNGFLWGTKEELINKTKKLVADKSFREKIAESAYKRSEDFDLTNFYRQVEQLIK